jgi:hypothetical protein
MPEEEKASLAGVGAGCAVNLLCGVAGAALGYAFMPNLPGLLGELFLRLIMWCGLGFIIGIFPGAFLAARVARCIDKPKT